jgi:hypothetical protein
MTAAAPVEMQRPSLLARAGSVVVSIVKHVPTRGALWGFLAFLVGWVSVGISIAIAFLHLGRGALILKVLFPIPLCIPFLGAALFAVHGVHRGAARAALEIEQKLGLVRDVVGRVMALLEARVGARVSSLPLAQFERHVRGALDQYLGSADVREGSGLTGWVVRRAKRAVVVRAERYLLTAYRAEERPDGSGGGVSLQKVEAHVTGVLSERLGEIVMSPLNKQLAIFMVLYVGVGVGWMYILFGVLSLIGVARPSAP